MANEDAKKLADSGDIAAAIALLEQQSDATAAVKAFEELIQHLYWQKKNLKAVCTVSHAALDRIERELSQVPAASSDALKLRAKVITYNLASFCWPGWGEPDIAIGEEELRIGHQAAQKHTALVKDLKLNNAALSRTAWINGALLLSMKDFAAAQEKFEESAQFAAQARNKSDSLMAKGYSLLTQLLATPEKQGPLREELAKVVQELKTEQDGQEYADQIATAEREAIRK